MLSKKDLIQANKELRKEANHPGESSDYQRGIRTAMLVFYDILHDKGKHDIANKLAEAIQISQTSSGSVSETQAVGEDYREQYKRERPNVVAQVGSNPTHCFMLNLIGLKLENSPACR